MKYTLSFLILLLTAVGTIHTSQAQVIYSHNFDNGPFNYPYNTPPTSADPNLIYTDWTNSSEEWGVYVNPDNSTNALSFPLNASINTFSFLIEAQEFSNSISSISFDSKIVGQGYGSYTLKVNDLIVSVGDIFVDTDPAGKGRLSTIQINELDYEIEGVKGKITFDFVIEGNPGSLFVIDNFEVNGYVATAGNYTPYGIGTKVNYRRVHEMGRPIGNIADTSGLTLGEHSIFTSYTDGIGRTIELVERRSSSTDLDKVLAIKYDTYNRQPKGYLPYAKGTEGKFRINPIAELNSYYDTIYPNEQQNFFASQLFDDASLSRQTTVTRPGNSFAGQSLGVTNQTHVNTAADGVRKWTFTGFDTPPVSSSSWPTATLLIQQATDESGNKKRTYVDKEGKTILSKVQVSSSAGDGHTAWLNTYFVYDEFGRLRQVIPPKAVDSMNYYSNWTINSSVFNELCYSYDYDKKGRAIAEKRPGKAVQYTIYDLQDRPVLIQDGNLRGDNDLLFNKYDGLGRVILSGRFLNTSGMTASQLRTEVENTSTSNAFIQFLQAKIQENNYTTSSSIADAEIFRIQYFDHYDQLAATFTYDNTVVQSLPGGIGAVTPIRSIEVLGMPTGGHFRMMSGNTATSQWLTSTIYYDNYGRPLQMQDINAKAGRDTVSFKYNFRGNLISTFSGLRNAAANVQGASVRMAKSFAYNDAGLLTHIYQNTNNEPYYRLINSASYDLLHQVNIESIGLSEYRKYSRNIWGGLDGINKDYYLNGTGNNFFGEIINYETGADVTNNLGMPSTLKWRMKGSEETQRSYVYNYDKAARLTSATYTQKAGLGTWANTTENYTADNLKYDGNGNLLSMDQWGTSPAQPAPFKMDELKYRYKNGGMSNILDAVDDQVTTNFSLGEFTEASGTTSTDYNYDDNGNATTDANKNITSIKYNLADKPYEIVFTGGRKINFDYDASGLLLTKRIYENSVLTTTIDYVSGLEYRNDTLVNIPHESGRIRPITIRLPNNSTQPYYEYDFFVKDHVGNVRSVVTQAPEQNWFTPQFNNGILTGFQQVTNYSPEQSGAIGFTTGLRTYLATNELSAATVEESFFENIVATRDSKPASASPADIQANRLNVNEADRKVGPALLIRVLSGDKFQISADAYYNSSGANYSGSQAFEQLLSQAVTTLTSGGAGIGVGEGVLNNIGTQSGNGSWATALADLTNSTPVSTQAPKAFLNYIFLDDNLQLVSGKSRIMQATTPDQWSTLQSSEVTLNQSGYLMVYVNNASGMDVYFDNVAVSHTKGKLLQESHYYPYGLTISSSQYANIKSNDKLFLGERLHRNEFSDNTGLNWSELGARQYDPQIGRWHSPDQLTNLSVDQSPYQYAFCNPIIFSDKSGLDPRMDDGGYDEDWSFEFRDPSNYDYSQNFDGSWNIQMGDWYYSPTFSSIIDQPDEYELGYWGGSGASDDGDGDGDRNEKPGVFATGMAKIILTLGGIGRQLSPPWTETGNRGLRGKQPKNVYDVIEDAEMGLNMMMILAAPVQMIANESLPVSRQFEKVESRIGFAPRAARSIFKLNFAKASSVVTNPVPNRLARVIPGNINANTLGALDAVDVFVTAADDIAGLSAKQIAKRLTIPNNSFGFKVIEFPTPKVGIASPINRINPGFIGFGRTAGGAREFVIPNQLIPGNAIIKLIK